MRTLTKNELSAVGGGVIEEINVTGTRISGPGPIFNIGQALNDMATQAAIMEMAEMDSMNAEPPADGELLGDEANALEEATDLKLKDGTDLNPDKLVIKDPVTRAMFEKFAEELKKMNPNIEIRITGGDRFVDSSGAVRSSTTGEIIPNTSPTGYHVHGWAIDFGAFGATPTQVSQAAAAAGLREPAYYPNTNHWHVGRNP